MFYAAALSPDGKTLAVGGTDQVIYLIALPAGRIDRVLKGYTRQISALAFSPDGGRLASGSGDHTAPLWDVGSGECVQTLRGHTRTIPGVAFSPDGRHLATASDDKTGRIWSVATGQEEALLRGHDQVVGCIAWSLDGSTLATGSFDQSIRLWGADGTGGRRFADLGSRVISVTFTADSRRLLFTRGIGKSFACSVLDLASGKEQVRFTRHSNSVLCGAFSPDGTLVATAGGNDHEIYLWNTANPLPRVGKDHEVLGQHAEVALALEGRVGPGPQRRAEPALVPREAALRLPALAVDPPLIRRTRHRSLRQRSHPPTRCGGPPRNGPADRQDEGVACGRPRHRE
jgi:WD40 repeat protein